MMVSIDRFTIRHADILGRIIVQHQPQNHMYCVEITDYYKSPFYPIRIAAKYLPYFKDKLAIIWQSTDHNYVTKYWLPFDTADEAVLFKLTYL